MDREGDLGERPLLLAHTDHRLERHRRLGLGRRHERAVADQSDEPVLVVDDGQRRDALLVQRVHHLVPSGVDRDGDETAADEVLQLGLGQRGRDLAERDEADEPAARVGEVDGTEVLLPERAHLLQRLVHGRVGTEPGDPWVHERARRVGRVAQDHLGDARLQEPELPLALRGRHAHDDRRRPPGVHRGQHALRQVLWEVEDDLGGHPWVEALEQLRRRGR